MRGWRGSGIVLLAAISVNGACTRGRRVPPDANIDVREYLVRADRAPAAGLTLGDAPAREWDADLGRGSLGAAAGGEGVAVVATVDRWIYAFDPATGRRYWRSRGDAPFGVGPLVTGGRVFVASEGRDGTVTAYELRRGKRLWRERVGDVAAPLSVTDSMVLGVTQTQGAIFALRASDGESLWRTRVGSTRSAPLPLGRHIAVVTLTDSLLILDAANGEVVRRVSLGASTAAPLARANDSTAIVASPSGRILAVIVPSGRIAWQVETGAPVPAAPVVARDTVFAITNRCTLWTIPVNGARADSTAFGCVTVAPPLITRHGVLVATVSGELMMFDRTTRERRWTLQTNRELRQPPLVLGERMLVFPSVGRVVSYR